MIYLLTGAPGTGKTASALRLLMTLDQYPDKVCVIGVREYKGKGLYFETLPENFDFSKYPGYCFLIDEAQDYWPSRVAGYKAPASLDFLPKHRHIGQDFILTCQFPTQLDVKLRQIVGRHIHLRSEPLGVFEYESGQCEDKLDFDPNTKRPRHSISAETKASYVSMEGETTALQKSKPRLPMKLWLVLGVVVVAFGFALYMLFGSDNIIKGLVVGDDTAVAVDEAQAFDPLKNLTGKSSTVNGQNTPENPVKFLREIRHPAELKPGNSDYPELAPQPRLPVSCIAGARSCVCYDQALQVIEGMSEDRCRGLVAGRDALVSAWARDDTPRLPLYANKERKTPPPPLIEDKQNAPMPVGK